jgi:biopolymer transport protein TolQ
LFMEALGRSGNPSVQKGEGRKGQTTRHPESVNRYMRAIAQDELSHLEHYLSFLATTGNVCPFIGLFGTVWGIIDAFQQIGIQGTASIAAVAPGVSEALVATAAGLFAAIPAVVGFNYYLNRLRVLSNQIDAFSAEFLGVLEERHAEVQVGG